MPHVYQLPWESVHRTEKMLDDGISLHMTPEDADQYVKNYWANLKPIPTQHSQPVPNIEPIPVEIDETTFTAVQDSKFGIRVYNQTMSMPKPQLKPSFVVDVIKNVPNS